MNTQKIEHITKYAVARIFLNMMCSGAIVELKGFVEMQ